MVNNSRNTPKVLVIGIDGATLDLVRPWAEAGRLPNFSSLMKNGVWGKLKSTIPPITAPAWTSFITGKNPGKHCIFDFIERCSDSYKIRYTNGGTSRAKSLWQILSEANATVGAINVPMTYPPEHVNGYIISGLDTPDETSNFIFPADLKNELKERFGGVRLDIRHLGYMNNDRKRDLTLEAMENLEEHRLKILTYLIEKHPTDFLMVVFNATDQVQHHFWHYMDDKHTQFDAIGAKKYGTAILTIYKKIDEILGKLIQSVPKNTNIIVMSDHGAGPLSQRYLYLNRYLEDIGVLNFKEHKKDNFKNLHLTLMKKLDGFLRSTISPHIKMRLNRLFPFLRSTMESYSSMNMIDWSKTKAYAVEISGTSPHIWINTKGNMPQGTVNKGAEYNELVDYIIKRIYELKDPLTGKQFVRKALRKEEIYEGNYVTSAPDIVLSWWDGDSFILKQSPIEKGPYIVCKNGGLKGGMEWSGTHRLDGMTILHGPHFKSGSSIENSEIIDLTPTILYLLGIPVPDDMDGKVLKNALLEKFFHSTPFNYQKSEEVANKTNGFYTHDEEEKVRDRLKKLGYID